MKINRVSITYCCYYSRQQIDQKYDIWLPENYKSSANGKKPTVHRNVKEFKNIEQRDNEDDYAYMRRVNRITQESAQEAKFEAKYGVEVVRNQKTGEIKLKKKPPNEIDERLKQNMENHKRAKKGGKPNAAPPAVVMSSVERREIVKKMMAEKKASRKPSEPVKDFKKDEFKFGEVVHGPPTLTTPRRGQKAETVSRVIIFIFIEVVQTKRKKLIAKYFSAWQEIIIVAFRAGAKCGYRYGAHCQGVDGHSKNNEESEKCRFTER